MAVSEEDKRYGDFIKAKLTELAEYMETQGCPYHMTASVIVGVGAGWLARDLGVEVANKSLDAARAGIEQPVPPGTKLN